MEVIRYREIHTGNNAHFKAGLIALLLSFSSCTFAQPGGKNSFEFVNVPNHARLAGLGGVNVSLGDHDINFFSSNPALTSDSLNGMASATYQAYVAKIGHAFIAYQHPFQKLGPITFAVQHINYGAIQGYDLNGMETSEFNSGETALYISKSHQVGNFRMGATIKGVFSNLAGYRATALMTDIGGLFVPNQRFMVGLVIKNLGTVLSDYSSAANSNVPIDVQLGFTIKPEHMPIRFSLTGYQLTRNISYFNRDLGDDKPGIMRKILEHVNFGAEILIHRNVNILVGYNYLIHQTLKLSEGGGGAGLSFGLSAAVKTVEFAFSRSAYVTGNAGYSFTLSTNLNKILKRR